MNWPKAAGETTATRAIFVLVLAFIAGVLIYLVATLIAGTSTDRGEQACAFAREQILARVERMGLYRGGHPCTAAALDDEEFVWSLDGVYRSGLVAEIQPSIPYTGVVIWDDQAEAFETCAIEFRRAGGDSTDVEIIEPATRPALCPA